MELRLIVQKLVALLLCQFACLLFKFYSHLCRYRSKRRPQPRLLDAKSKWYFPLFPASNENQLKLSISKHPDQTKKKFHSSSIRNDWFERFEQRLKTDLPLNVRCICLVMCTSVSKWFDSTINNKSNSKQTRLFATKVKLVFDGAQVAQTQRRPKQAQSTTVDDDERSFYLLFIFNFIRMRLVISTQHIALN